MSTVYQEERSELECKLLCFKRISQFFSQQLLQFLSLNSDIALNAQVGTPGEALSTILEHHKQHVFKIEALKYDDIKSKIYSDPKIFKTSIDVNMIDTTPVCEILLQVPAYPTCTKKCCPIDQIIHSDKAACTYDTVCCSYCISCTRCCDKCKFSNIGIREFKYLRNIDSHYTPKEFKDVSDSMEKQPKGQLALEWEKKLNLWRDIIVKVLTLLCEAGFMDDSVYKHEKLKLENVLMAKKDVYLRVCFPDEHINTLIIRNVYCVPLTITFKLSTEEWDKLTEVEELTSESSISLRKEFQYESKKILTNHLNLNGCSEFVDISLNKFKFKDLNRNTCVIATLRIKSVENYIISKEYEDTSSDEAVRIMNELKGVLEPALKRTTGISILKVRCVGYEFSSINVNILISGGKTNSERDKIKMELGVIVRENYFTDILDKCKLNGCEITLTFPSDEQCKFLKVEFKIICYSKVTDQIIVEQKHFIKERIEDKCKNIIQNLEEDSQKKETFPLVTALKMTYGGFPLSFSERMLAYKIGELLSENPIKAEKVVKTLLPHDVDAAFLHKALKKGYYVEILSYWIHHKLPNDPLAELNQVLRECDLSGFCLTSDEFGVVTPFQDILTMCENQDSEKEQKFREKLLAFKIGLKLAKNPLKSEKVGRALLTHIADQSFLTSALKDNHYLEIIRYWIAKHPGDTLTKLNQVLRDCGYANFSLTHNELDEETCFQELKDETPLSNKHREEIYEHITKKCIEKARYIGHFLLPYEDVSAIYKDQSTVKGQLDKIMQEVSENHSPSWACLKALFIFLGMESVVTAIETDILKVGNTKDAKVQDIKDGKQTYDQDLYYLQICHKLDVATDCARKLLLEVYESDADSFQYELDKRKHKVEKLMKKKVLRKHEFEILFPSDGSKTNPNHYDFTLVFTLYRLSGDQKYNKDFDDLRNVRNRFAHNGLRSISGNIFMREIQCLDKFVNRFGTYDQKQRMIKQIKHLENLGNTIPHGFQGQRSQSDISNENSHGSGVMPRLDNPLDSYIDRDVHLYAKMFGSKPVVVSGPGGCGKSELVRYFCKCNADEFDRNILWMDSNSKNAIKSSFKEHIHWVKADCKDVDDDDFKKLASILFTYFIDHKKRFLVIFDDVQKRDDIEPFFPPRSDNHGYILITSQLSEWGERYTKIELDPVLGKKKGFQLVQSQLANGYGNYDDMELLCKTLGNFPLALQIAIAYIKENNRLISMYLSMFENSTKMLDKVPLDDKYMKTISTVWKIAFSEIEKHKFAFDLIYVMAYMDGSCIERSFFEDGEFCEIEQLDEALAVLRSYCLIRYGGNAINCSISIHEMVQLVVRKDVYHTAKKNYPLLFIHLLKKVILKTIEVEESFHFWQKHLDCVISSMEQVDNVGIFYELYDIRKELKGTDKNTMKVKSVLNKYAKPRTCH